MIEIHRVHTFSNDIIMRMTDKEEVICEAHAVARDDGTAEIISIGNDSYDMGKALLNAIDLMGIRNVTCFNKDMDRLLKALRFNFENDMYTLNLEGYFTGGC